ncbi:MAG: hypothetical protein K0S79_2334 [Nitrospira sp.]|nr:hypothetical protein [Nitrospira sp.]
MVVAHPRVSGTERDDAIRSRVWLTKGKQPSQGKT